MKLILLILSAHCIHVSATWSESAEKEVTEEMIGKEAAGEWLAGVTATAMIGNQEFLLHHGTATAKLNAWMFAKAITTTTDDVPAVITTVVTFHDVNASRDTKNFADIKSEVAKDTFIQGVAATNNTFSFKLTGATLAMVQTSMSFANVEKFLQVGDSTYKLAGNTINFVKIGKTDVVLTAVFGATSSEDVKYTVDGADAADPNIKTSLGEAAVELVVAPAGSSMLMIILIVVGVVVLGGIILFICMSKK